MDGLHTPRLLRGRLLVAAGEETTHYDVIGSGAHAMPECEVGRLRLPALFHTWIQSATSTRMYGSSSLITIPVLGLVL